MDSSHRQSLSNNLDPRLSDHSRGLAQSFDRLAEDYDRLGDLGNDQFGDWLPSVVPAAAAPHSSTSSSRDRRLPAVGCTAARFEPSPTTSYGVYASVFPAAGSTRVGRAHAMLWDHQA